MVHAVAYERLELAADPSRERQRESLFGTGHGRPRQWSGESHVEQLFIAHQRRLRAEGRPDRVEEYMVDERYAHLERVRHRHRVHVAQQLRPEIDAGFEPCDVAFERAGRRGV